MIETTTDLDIAVWMSLRVLSTWNITEIVIIDKFTKISMDKQSLVPEERERKNGGGLGVHHLVIFMGK